MTANFTESFFIGSVRPPDCAAGARFAAGAAFWFCAVSEAGIAQATATSISTNRNTRRMISPCPY